MNSFDYWKRILRIIPFLIMLSKILCAKFIGSYYASPTNDIDTNFPWNINIFGISLENNKRPDFTLFVTLCFRNNSNDLQVTFVTLLTKVLCVLTLLWSMTLSCILFIVLLAQSIFLNNEKWFRKSSQEIWYLLT